MELYWEAFVILVAENEENMIYPVYKVLLKHFPLEYMEKLVHTMVMGSSKVIQNYASILVAYHFYEIMRRKFLDIGEERLDHFKRVAIHFLLSQELGSHKKRCGKVMVSTILELSLHHNRDWNAFVKVASMGFVSWKAGIQDMILDIFVELNVILQCRFCKLLRPLLQRPHFNVLLEMLERGHDVRPFYISRASLRCSQGCSGPY